MKHSDHRPSPWVAVSGIILLGGLLAAAILLSREFLSREPDPSPQAPSSQAVSTPSPSPTPTAAPTASPTPGPIPDDGTDGYLSENLYIWKDAAFELFYGYDESAEPYAQAIDSFAQRLPADVKVYNMVVPNHSELALPERIRNAQGCGSQRDNARHIYSLFSYAQPVDVFDNLYLHKDEYLYFNTDTHWTALGAYYAYEVFCETANVPLTPLDQFTKTEHEGFLGYLYQLTGDETLAANPDSVQLYEPGFPYQAEVSQDGLSFTELPGINASDASMGYGMLLWGDNPCLHVKNEYSYTGRRLALVKESYGNAIGAFLASSFDDVYAIDFRSFPLSLPDFISEHEITDVLFLNSAAASNTSARVEELLGLFPTEPSEF